MTSPGGTFVNYAGKKPPPGQAERRADLLIPDQHSRNLHIVWDTLARGCVGIYVQFRAPWVPDISYAKIVAKTGYPTAVEWDYKQLLEDTRNAWERWFQDLRRFSGKMNGVSATEAYKYAREGNWAQVPKALLEECGITPESEDVIKAAMAGNKWILGFSTVVPDWAEPWLALKEAQRARASIPVTEDELAKFRDAETDADTDLDEEFDPEAVGGKRVAVPHKEPTKPTQPTRRQVRLTAGE